MCYNGRGENDKKSKTEIVGAWNSSEEKKAIL
jgi:hypothetical protein